MIRGEFDPSDPYPKPWVRVLVYLDGISPIWVKVPFLIDTGAARTCLHPRDALTVGVPRRSLVRRAAWQAPPLMVRGVGGTMEYYQTPASYAFETTSGDLHVVDGTILVARATPTNTTLPSLLGCDLLRGFHLNVPHDTGLIELDPISPNVLSVPSSP